MKDKGHFWCSIIKSAIRILACGLAVEVAYIDSVGAVVFLATGLGLAELVGILEEFLDKR